MEGTWNAHQELGAPFLVGGFGRPWQRDLDFGSRFVCAVEDLDWPEAVVVEDLSYSAFHVMHRLEELRPAKLIMVAAVPRGEDPPGTLRRYLVSSEPPPPDEVHGYLVEALGGEPDLEQTLAVARHWGALPPGSVILEVQPRDTSLGLGLSEDVAASIDKVLAAVRRELDSALAPAAPTLSDERIYAQLPGT
jgi:hydrogenase maturation protease